MELHRFEANRVRLPCWCGPPDIADPCSWFLGIASWSLWNALLNFSCSNHLFILVNGRWFPMKVCSKRSRRNCDFFLFGLPSSPRVLPKMLSSPLKSSKTANYSNSLIFGRFSIFRAFTLEKPLKYGLLQVPPSSLNFSYFRLFLNSEFWLEISCTSRYRGFESHSLRHQEPVIKPITGSFLFPKRAIPCSFTFSERKSSVPPNIKRSPPASEVAALR